MRIPIAILVAATAFAGCISEETEPTASIAPELGALGLTNITAQAAAWAYAIVAATEDGDVAGMTFTVTEEAIAAAQAQGSGLFLQVIPLLPADVAIEKYAVLVFDAGYQVNAEAANVAAQAQATAAAARAQAEASGAQATLVAAELFTALDGAAQGAMGSAKAAADVGAGPVTVPLPSDAAVGDVFGIVIGLQTQAGAVASAQGGLDPAQAAAAVDLEGKAAILVSLAGKAQSSLPSATDALAQAEALAAQGQGILMPVLGQAQGFAIPAFSFSVDGRTAQRVLLASSDIQAQVQTTANGLWPLLSTESFSLDVASEVASGFGSHLGGVTGDFGRLQYDLVADVHGQAASLSDQGINAVGAAKASAGYALSASGLGGTDLSFDVTSQGRDLTGALWAVGVELGAPLEVLLGQSGLPVKELASAGAPIGTASGITFEGPLGVWTLHR